MHTNRHGIGSQRGQWGLIAMLIAVLIVAILFVVVLLPKMKTSVGGGEKPMPEAAMDKAKEVQCMSNLRSVRQGIVMYKSQNETLPPSMKDLKMGMGADFFKCPVGMEPYQYDPNTGAVRCPHPGHGRF